MVQSNGESGAANPCRGAAEEFLVLSDAALVRQCAVDHYRSQGPGGQKRNKTSSAVRLRHRPTGLAVTAVEDRSQHVNQARAVRRLRQAIALRLRSILDMASYRPSATLASAISASSELCVGRRDARYDRVVAELLDVLAGCDLRVSRAAKCLGVTTSHLVKFFRDDPKLWECVNRVRAQAGIGPLK